MWVEEIRDFYKDSISEEDFVSYEQALKLRQLGFDRPTLMYYAGDGEGTKADIIAQRQIVTRFYNSMNQSFGNDDVCDAPTLYNAAKWLRDEKKIDIGIQHHYWPEGILYELSVGDRENLEDEFLENYKTYDEALRAGIDEAIRMLEKRYEED